MCTECDDLRSALDDVREELESTRRSLAKATKDAESARADAVHWVGLYETARMTLARYAPTDGDARSTEELLTALGPHSRLETEDEGWICAGGPAQAWRWNRAATAREALRLVVLKERDE